MPLNRFEWNTEYQVTTRRATDTRLHPPKKDAGSKSNSTRGLTSHSQLKRQAECQAKTQDKACLPCSNSRETLTLMSEMERGPEVPTSALDESLFIPAATQEEFRGAYCNSKADLTSLRKHKQVPRVFMQLQRNPKLSATTPQK